MLGLSVYADGTVGVISCSESAIATLTGLGGEYSIAWGEREIAIRTNPEREYPAPIALVREYISGMTHGNLSDSEAVDLLQRMADLSIEQNQGKSCIARHQIEASDLPKDRTFRDAWAWID